MDKDNHLLGQFTMHGIPPAPKRQEKFTVTFDLDADSILKVTAKHQGTGKTQDITIDAKAVGRLTTEEINDIIKKAEKMKISDDEEEKRALAKDRLEALCSDIRQKSQAFSKWRVWGLLYKVSACETWLKDSHNEDEIELKQVSLLKEAAKLLPNIKEEGKKSAEHLRNLSKMTPYHCLWEGWYYAAKGAKEDLYLALELFGTAYAMAQSSKRPRAHMTQANTGMGHVIRKLLQKETETSQILDLAIKGVQRLAQAMELDKGEILGKESKADTVKDFQFVADTFFLAAEKAGNAEGWALMKKFLRAVENDARIKGPEWKRVVLAYCIRAANFCLALMQKEIEQNEFAATLTKIRELTSTKEQLKRLVDRHSRQEVDRILADLDVRESTASGIKELFFAEEALLKRDEDKLDLALLALDHINKAKKLTKECHPHTYWRSKFYEGQIFWKHLGNRARAKSCFTEIVESNEARTFLDVHTEAKLNLRKLEEEEAKAKEEKMKQANMESNNEDFAADLEKVDEANHKMSDEEFLDFLLSTFPPKHKKEYQRPDMTNKIERKKAITKVTTYYHPDKVDAAAHGQEFKMFCQEITKRLNKRATRYRTM